MYTCWKAFVLVMVCSGRATASGRELTATTAAAPAPSSSDRSGQSGLPALREAPTTPAAAASTDLQRFPRLSATSANLTAAAIESAIESGPTIGGVVVQPPCNYDCGMYSRSSLGAAAAGSDQYFAACRTEQCANNQGTQYYCCPQACEADSDCPSNYFCPGGASGDSYCSKCSSCSETGSAKCQSDQRCTFPCCLNAAGNACPAPPGTKTKAFSAETCCPSSSTSYSFDAQTSQCNCGTPQSCPGLPSPSPPPPPGPPRAASTVLSSADEVPMVTAYHKLGGFSVATFDAAAQNTFLSALEDNIGKISGPVKVFIPTGGITDGSVNVKLSVMFLNGESESAKAYKSALTGNSPSGVYGTYDAYVDPATFATETAANPSQGSSRSGAVQHSQLGAVAAFSMALATFFCS